MLGLDPSGRYLGILGGLDQRKTVLELLAAFRRADLPADHRLLLAGRLDSLFAQHVSSDYQDLVRSGRLVVLDRYLSEQEMLHGYEALDLATITYGRFAGLASLGLKAIASGTPLIAHDCGWLRGLIDRFEVGSHVDTFDVDAFASAIKRSLERPRGWAQPEAVRRLLAFHAEENFATLMCQTAASMSGTAQSAAVEWSWVLDALPPANTRVAPH